MNFSTNCMLPVETTEDIVKSLLAGSEVHRNFTTEKMRETLVLRVCDLQDTCLETPSLDCCTLNDKIYCIYLI